MGKGQVVQAHTQIDVYACCVLKEQIACREIAHRPRVALHTSLSLS